MDINPIHIAETVFHHHPEKPAVEPTDSVIHVGVEPTPQVAPAVAINLPSVAVPTIEGAKPLATAATPIATAATAAEPTAAEQKETLIQKIEADAKKVWSVIETAGKDSEKALSVLVSYAPEGAALASVFFPAEQATLTGVVTAVDLIQNAVLKVKQQSALLPEGLPSEQMLADELAMVGPAVTQLLTSEGVSADNTLITNIINGVVAILKVRPVTATA